MIVAFDSMEKEDVRAINNMIASALAISVRKEGSVVLVESGFGGTRVRDALDGRERGMIKEPFTYMEGCGMDYLIKRSQYRMLNPNSAKGGMAHITGQLSYVPGAVRRERLVYEEEFDKECTNILEQLNQTADYVFVECCGVPEITRRHIVDKSHLVVVNVSQSEQVLDEYFSFKPVYHGKSLYCIGDYIREDSYNVKNIQRIYRIESEHIGVIPYNVEFLSSMKKGRTLAFFKNHLLKARNYRNKDFFEGSFKMADMIKQWEGCNARVVMPPIFIYPESEKRVEKTDTFLGGINPVSG